MRVLHVIPSIARSAGGPSEVVRELLPQLEEHGISVRLVTTDKGAIATDHDVFRRPNVAAAKSIASRWTFAPALVPILWREIADADLVHVHSIHTFPSTLAMLIGRLRRKPVLLQPHGALNSYHLSQRRLLKIAYLRIVDRWGLGAVRTALYSSHIEVADGRAVLPDIPSATLPLGIEERILEIARAESAPPRILFLARLAKKKRLDILLQALASSALSDTTFEAIIAGPTDDDLDYDPRLMIQKLGLTTTRMIGQVDAAERAKLLASTSIYVLPSDDESFGMSVAEAMGAGCAVICSPFVGVASDARSAGAALIVEQDAERVARSIRELLNGTEEREDLGRRARRYASEHLTWPKIGDQLVAYYRRTVSAAS